jgi:hypothetical protein
MGIAKCPLTLCRADLVGDNEARKSKSGNGLRYLDLKTLAAPTFVRILHITNYSQVGIEPLSAIFGQVRPSVLNVGIQGEKGPSPPSPDPYAGAYGIAMGDRISPSLLNPAGSIDNLKTTPLY